TNSLVLLPNSFLQEVRNFTGGGSFYGGGSMGWYKDSRVSRIFPQPHAAARRVIADGGEVGESIVPLLAPMPWATASYKLRNKDSQSGMETHVDPAMARNREPVSFCLRAKTRKAAGISGTRVQRRRSPPP